MKILLYFLPIIVFLSCKKELVYQYIEKDYTVRSQMDGRVYNVLKEQGEIVSPQSPLLVMGWISSSNCKLMNLILLKYKLDKRY